MGIFDRGRYSRQNPPGGSGLYRFICKLTKEIVYIGETVNLEHRIRIHLQSDKPVSPETHHIEWKKTDGRSTSRTRRIHERKKINQHKPRLNRRGGGGGRRARR